MTAGLLAAQPGDWIGALSGGGEAAVLDAWPPSGDAPFAGLLLGYAFAQSVALNLTAADSITDSSIIKLDGAQDIATFESGGSTYAAIVSFVDNSVQIIDITDPFDITAAGSITGLAGAGGIATFESGNSTYAAVTAFFGDAVQILDVTDPFNITVADSIGNDGTLELNGPWGIATFESGGSTYAAVASFVDNGVQILDVTDPSDITAAGSIGDDGTLALRSARDIATFESGNSTYAAVAAFDDGGVQILNVTDPSNVTAAGSITDTTALVLRQATSIATFESGNSTYAAVTSSGDDGVQILDITDPFNVTAGGQHHRHRNPQAGRPTGHRHVHIRRQHLRGGRLIRRRRHPDT